MILPGATLGVLGGGQLGRMFTIRARTMGYRVLVLDPDPSSPAGQLADRHIRAGFDDAPALDELATACAAVTTEFENVPSAALERLSRATTVRPGPRAIAIAQDRIAEKTLPPTTRALRLRHSARWEARPRWRRPRRRCTCRGCSRPAGWGTTGRARRWCSAPRRLSMPFAAWAASHAFWRSASTWSSSCRSCSRAGRTAGRGVRGRRESSSRRNPGDDDGAGPRSRAAGPRGPRTGHERGKGAGLRRRAGRGAVCRPAEADSS